MSNKQMRNIIRAVHLAASIMLIGLVYSADLRNTEGYVMFLQVVVIPIVAISGISMWQQAAISKLRRSLSGQKAAA